jgi:hypothetical protein
MLRGLRVGLTESEAAKVIGKVFNAKTITTEISIMKSGDKFIQLSKADRNYEANKVYFDAGITKFDYPLDGVSPLPLSADFKDVNKLRLIFHRKILRSVFISYDAEGLHWKNVDDFVSNITEKMGIPKSYWYFDEYYFTARMTCSSSSRTTGGLMQVSSFSINALVLGDVATLSEVDSSFDEERIAKESYIKKLNDSIDSSVGRKKLFKP